MVGGGDNEKKTTTKKQQHKNIKGSVQNNAIILLGQNATCFVFRMLYFILINSVILNLLCVRSLF